MHMEDISWVFQIFSLENELAGPGTHAKKQIMIQVLAVSGNLMKNCEDPYGDTESYWQKVLENSWG